MRFHEFGVYEINTMLAAISVPNNVFDVSGDFARVPPGSVRPPSSVIFTARMNRDKFGCKFRERSRINQSDQVNTCCPSLRDEGTKSERLCGKVLKNYLRRRIFCSPASSTVTLCGSMATTRPPAIASPRNTVLPLISAEAFDRR